MSNRALCVLGGCLLALVLQGCASSVNVMIPATATPEPDASSAVVTFMRPSSFAFAIKFGMWDGEELVGVLSAKSKISITVAPGEHVFLGRAENWAVVKANLEAGKHYYVLVRPRMGLAKAGVIMDPVKADTTEAQLTEWLDKSNPVQIDPAQEAAYVSARLPQVRTALQNVADGKADFNVLATEDGR